MHVDHEVDHKWIQLHLLLYPMRQIQLVEFWFALLHQHTLHKVQVLQLMCSYQVAKCQVILLLNESQQSLHGQLDREVIRVDLRQAKLLPLVQIKESYFAIQLDMQR